MEQLGRTFAQEKDETPTRISLFTRFTEIREMLDRQWSIVDNFAEDHINELYEDANLLSRLKNRSNAYLFLLYVLERNVDLTDELLLESYSSFRNFLDVGKEKK